MIIQEQNVTSFNNESELHNSFRKHRDTTKCICSQQFAEENFHLEVNDYVAEFDKVSTLQGKYTITDIAKEWWSAQKDGLSKADCYHYVICLYWYRSVSGLKREMEAKQWLFIYEGIDVDKAPAHLDRRYAIDLIDDDKRFPIQVKPPSHRYYEGPNKMADKLKMLDYYNMTGVKVLVLCQNNDGSFEFIK